MQFFKTEGLFNRLFKNTDKVGELKDKVFKKTKPFVAPTLLVIVAGGIFFFLSKRLTRQLDKIKRHVDHNSLRKNQP